MNRAIVLLAAMGVLIAPYIVVAGGGSEPAAGAKQVPVSTESEDADDDDGKMRCKSLPVLGSRVGKRVCRTEEQWAAAERGAKEFMRDIEGTPRRDRHFERNGGISTPTSDGVGPGGF